MGFIFPLFALDECMKCDAFFFTTQHCFADKKNSSVQCRIIQQPCDWYQIAGKKYPDTHTSRDKSEKEKRFWHVRVFID